MPRDVATRWNSTFDMLEFALLYRKPLDDLTNNREMKLRSYELSEEEWVIAEQLAGVLKVRCQALICFNIKDDNFVRFLSKQHSSSQEKHPIYRR